MRNLDKQSFPTVWMNVTTSANWNRPPVGIVRVEQELCLNLEKIIPEGFFKRCVWQNDRFVEWFPRKSNALNEVLVGGNGAPPMMDTLLLSIGSLFKPLRNRAVMGGGVPQVGLNVGGEAHQSETANQPKWGDILISVGLDWDQSYTPNFYTLKEKHGIKIITCCYDLIPVLFPQYCVGDVSTRFKEYFNTLTWGSSAVLCISKQTQKDFLALCKQIGAPERPTEILPLGDNVPGNVGEVSDEIENLCSEPFILFVSTIERRKNHEVLYRAYHLLCRQGYRDILPKLVFVGMPGWGVNDLLKDIELDPETSDLIVQLNNVSDAGLSKLYEKAFFFAYPSLYEGWGLPVGEALAMGKAVMASDRGSLPEVGGDLVRYVDPWDAQEWADAILDWVQSPDMVIELEKRVVSNYSIRKWSDSADMVLNLIKRLDAGESEIEPELLLPGYDFSTQVGMHIGPCLQSVGKDGFLMYGPHKSLAAGTYNIQIFAQASGGGIISMDCVSDAGNTSYWGAHFNLEEREATSDEFVQFEITLAKPVNDFEIRCMVNKSANVNLSKIVISKLNQV